MTRAIKPILDSGLFESIENALVQFSNRNIWKSWGLNSLREQGAALLFYGKSGTGKTTTARWCAKALNLNFRPIDFSEIGSDKPGQLAKNIKYLFLSQTPKEGVEGVDDRPSLILIDECDTVLLDRKKLAYNSLWMLEPINQLLVSIRQYRGLVILATNQDTSFLDPALESRILGKFYFDNPLEPQTRVNLWKSKWPSRLPVQPNDRFFDIAEKYDFNGSEIEQFLIHWAGDAIRTAGNGDPGENLKLDKLINMMLNGRPE